MLLPKHIFSVMLALWLTDGRDLSLQLDRAVPPVHPVNTQSLGMAVVEIQVNSTTGALDTRVLYGEAPFVTSALKALKQWRFHAPAGAEVSRTSVTFLFRPPAVYSLKPGSTLVRPWMPGEDWPALPQEVIDPGYPAASIVTGAVILAARIDAAGVVSGIETVVGIGSLTEQARFAVKDWKFSPAIVSGERVPSTAFVVISFVLPT